MQGFPRYWTFVVASCLSFAARGRADVPALTFDRYHGAGEIEEYLSAIAQELPAVASLSRTTRTSQLGKPLQYLVLSRKDGRPRSALFFNGAHHGNEWSSAEAVLGFVDFVVRHPNDPTVVELLDHFDLVLQPVVNPDGYQMKTREGATGTDLNRDYAYPLKEESLAFKSPETRFVRDVTNEWPIRGAIAFHSGMEGVLWPSCFTDKPTLDHKAFYTLSKITAEAMGLNLYQQSFRDYPTEGEFIDYVYMKNRALGLTLEVSRDGIPNETELSSVVSRALKGTLAYARSLLALDRGQLQVQDEPQSHRKSFGIPVLAGLVPAN